ncbi:MAG: PQQ-dependent sugar dehydrogenase [Rhizobiaceae bacterium]|nr:PQQ-dependent sugar dehydrogenase [Rhizobiaceae bacterium]
MNKILILALFTAAWLASAEFAAAHRRAIQAGAIPATAETMAAGLENPWSLEFLPDGAALVTERPGRLRILEKGELSAPLSGVPQVADSGQGGLLDLALANDFASSGTIYMSYAEPGPGGAGTAIARATLVRGETPALQNVRIIFSMEKKSGAGQHFGSRIVVAPDGTLFFTIGDRGDRERAQDFSDHAGAVLRIAPDGSIPAGNPWPGEAEIQPELWSKGHRNPQGAVWDPLTESLWTVEHGARGGDEVNQPQAGLNYGWPVISYGRHYSGLKIGVGTEAEGYEQPLFYWDPSIAPSGMTVYDGDMFPEWQGDFLIGALRAELVVRLERDANGNIVGEERLFDGFFGRIRDVKVAPDGAIWLLTDESDGSVIRVSRGE